MHALLDPRHIAFVLDEVLHVEHLLALPAFAAHDRQSIDQILDAAEKLAKSAFLPCHAHLDANEPRLENGRVVLPGEIETALAAFRDGGFLGMAADPADGGLGLPRMVANAVFLWFQAANVSIANYALLTNSAVELLAHHATPEQKQRYLAPMLEGRAMGTMALSEPQAGSSLGDIATIARALPDGRYAIRGTKMWISGGEHDMAENIVHLMLARIEGAPPGVKGLSLFIVPRRRVDATGGPGEWNNIAIAGLNHKLGQRGTVNTILNVGEGGDSIGEIIGAPGQGLACMFTMMNEARIGVSMGAVAHASAGYLHSLAYARERVQGRHPDNKDPTSPQMRLIEHADVRRMLLQQKAAAEGGIAMGLLLAKFADLKKAAATAKDREEASLLLDFLTPVLKAWISEESLAANYNAIQLLGGAGYTRDHPVEQHYRDNRLNPIHEGTNGIQAIDLLGRKVVMAEGRAIRLFIDEVQASLGPMASGDIDPWLVAKVRTLVWHVEQALRLLTAVRASRGLRPALALANDFMELVGATAFAWIWVVQARAAARVLAGTTLYDADLLQGKIATCAFVMAHVAPRGLAAADRIRMGGDGAFAMPDERFG